MSCCGKGRHQTMQPTTSAAPRARAMTPNISVTFEYTGSGKVTVIGPVTGRIYEFNGPGSQLRVDLRDRPHLMHVPRLRQIA